MKKVVLSILLISWTFLIFYFSNQPSVESSNVSDKAMSKIINIFETVFNYEFDEYEIDIIYEYGITPLRKCAHISIYFILGMLVYSLVKEYKLKNTTLISILLCVLFSCSDEIHQLFVFGRAGRIIDVLIDTIGILLGIFVIKKIIK